MWFFVPRSVAIGQGAMGTGAALLAILIIVGIIHAFLVSVFAAIAAAIAAIGLMIASRVFGWDAGFKLRPLFQILVNAFMAMTVVTWLLDLAAGTHFSVPTMIVALDARMCDPYCAGASYSNGGMDALVQSVSDFYRYNVAGDGGWLRYAVQQIPGLIAFAWVLGSGEPQAFQTAPPAMVIHGPKARRMFSAQADSRTGTQIGLVRLAIASAACVAGALILVFPVFIQLMLGLRSLAR